jgi:hypothetical protein
MPGAFAPLELTLPQDAPQVAMAAVHAPNPRQQGARKDSEPHYPAQNAKAEPDYLKFMKDIKAELGALLIAFGRMEALINRKRKPDDRKDKQGKVHAGLAQGKNHKAQKGAASQATRPMPSSYMCSSEEEQSDGFISPTMRGCATWSLRLLVRNRSSDPSSALWSNQRSRRNLFETTSDFPLNAFLTKSGARR